MAHCHPFFPPLFLSLLSHFILQNVIYIFHPISWLLSSSSSPSWCQGLATIKGNPSVCILDPVSSLLLKSFAPPVIHSCSYLINFSFSMGSFPSLYKYVLVSILTKNKITTLTPDSTQFLCSLSPQKILRSCLRDFPGGAVVKKPLPVQWTRVWALVREDPTCRGATKPVCHSYWARTLEPTSHNYWACVPQLLKPVHLELVLHNRRSHRNEKPAHRIEE